MLRALRERLEDLLRPSGSDSGSELREDPEGSFPVLLLALVRGTLERDRYGLAVLDPEAAAQQIVEFFLKGARR
jgi:hypothetical protein